MKLIQFLMGSLIGLSFLPINSVDSRNKVSFKANLDLVSAINLRELTYTEKKELHNFSILTSGSVTLSTGFPGTSSFFNLAQKYIQVNLFNGSNGAGSGWNNWNVQSSFNLNSTIYSDGSPSPVKASINVSDAIADNGASYPVTMCPQAVGRTCSYSTMQRWITLTGLDDSKQYDLEVYGSRSSSANNSTRFIVGGATIVVNTTNNYSNKALFTNLKSSAGQVRLDIQTVNVWNYINGFILIENDGGGNGNASPIAVPGQDQVVLLPITSILLDASGSYDPDGTIINYNWTKISGPSAIIASPTSASTSISNLVAGTYIFQLSVTDDVGATGYGNVQIIVNEEYIPPDGGDSLNCNKPFKVVVLGSSTAAGVGASSVDSSWVNKFLYYMKQKNSQSQIINLAEGGFTTYHVLNPTGYIPVNGRPQPDPNKNITKALSYDPDLIIVNLPSNDNANNYSLQEQKDNYERTMNLANAANVPVYVTTTQPRNGLTSTQRNRQISMRDWTYERFNEKAIDFWSTIANNNGTINSLYNADGIHVNNAGHHLLFTRVVSEHILDTLCLIQNVNPVANAGSDISIFLPQDSVLLNGSGSYDPDGTIAFYDWTKINGPLQFNISNPEEITLIVTGLSLGVYEFILTVTDNLGLQSQDTIKINVDTNDPVPPVAIAGNDSSIILPFNSIQLNAAASYDPDGTIESYNWIKISGPANSTIMNPGNSMTLVSELLEGEYIFELTVIDNDGMTAKDSINVTVLPIPNQPPVAITGPDITIPYPENSVQLDGSLSIDNDGFIISFNWNNLSAPGQYSISDSTLVTPVLSNLVSGTYVFELTVTDDDDDTGRDTIAIQVGYPPNQSPVANAGDDQSITLPASTIILNAQGSYDPDGSIVSYNWIKISGPSASITNINSSITTVTGLTSGSYIFKLTITDNQGAVDTDSVALILYPPLNTVPFANAGSDQAITLPTNNIMLNGSLSFDNNGTIVLYQWSQVAGPSNANLGNPSQPVTTAGNLVEGLYQFELLVVDDSSTTGKDTVLVVVNPAPTVTQKYVQVNIYNGSNGAGTGWNNWNVQNSFNLNSTIYSDGSSSPVKATINISDAIADNGANYPVTMCPQSVGRTSSYTTMRRWINITGLDDAKQYDLEVYGTRSSSANNSTRYITGGTTIVVSTTNNYSNKAVFNNLNSTGGVIRLDIETVNVWNYINGFILTEYTNSSSLISRSVINENSSYVEVQQQKSTSKQENGNDKTNTLTNDSFYVLPNPVKGDFKLIGRSNEKGRMDVKVYNLDGKALRDLKFDKPFEYFERQMQLADLKSGVYFIKIWINKKSYVVRVIKL